ncbi:hypothetical protein BDZ97DRAFT_1838697 [Flammula alnicola]|nr:hypothetical protein BDZ97DRAFT_1838697 [Flammula alnicola]
MGKSKSKGFKTTSPLEKFLVVVNPWGLNGDFVTSDFNQISAWFEFMLRDEYPGARVRSIYYQRTELMSISLATKLIMNHNLDWSIGYPNYSEIPATIPLRSPYPCPHIPGPPPSDISCARPFPTQVYESRLLRLASESQMMADGATTSPAPPRDGSSREPSQYSTLQSLSANKGKEKMRDEPSSPAHLKGAISNRRSIPSVQLKKMDPYEEEEESKALLRSPSPIKDEAEDFLSSVLGEHPAKEEEKPLIFPTEPDGNQPEDDYQPSAELLAMLGTLPPELKPDSFVHSGEDYGYGDPRKPVKPEPVDESIPVVGISSSESLPPELLIPVPEERLSVKEEFQDVKGERDYKPHTYHIVKQEPSGIPNQRYPPTQRPGFQETGSNFRVKPEPVDDGFSNHFRPRDARDGPLRDPRIRRMESSSSTSGYANKRDNGHLRSDNGRVDVKRIKTEYE